MAYAYHNLYDINFFGIRFFTVYGSSLRPDMALFKFIQKIKLNKTIELFNYGKNMRDFTYINDLNYKMTKIIEYMNKNSKKKIFEVINFGNGKKISTLNAVKTIGKLMKKKIKIKFSKKHRDDMFVTISDIKKQKKIFGKINHINFKDGIKTYLKSL